MIIFDFSAWLCDAIKIFMGVPGPQKYFYAQLIKTQKFYNMKISVVIDRDTWTGGARPLIAGARPVWSSFATLLFLSEAWRLQLASGDQKRKRSLEWP